MVDVMLVLLVIMMVSATYIVSRALKVELPKSASSDEAAQAPHHGDAHEGRRTSSSTRSPSSGDDDAHRALPQGARRRPASRASSSAPTAQALHGWVVHVIDLAKLQGITKFAINVAE